MNARDYKPHERLHISNHAYSPKHVNNIASWLAQSCSVQLPYGFPHVAQNKVAEWIIEKFGYDFYQIEKAEEIVRSNYASKQKIFRKGRPIGSKNTNTYNNAWQDETGPENALDALLDGTSNEATDTAASPETPASDVASQPSGDAQAMRDYVLGALTNYVRKVDFESNINRIGQEVNTHMRNHSEQIKAYCESNFTKLFDKVNSIELSKPTVVTLERQNLAPLELGVTHRHFPRLLKMCNAALRNKSHLNIWIYGPAGTGKSTAAEKIAEALSLDFYTNGKLATEYAVLGFINTTGYQTTQFRQAFENGGIYLADEIDGSMPDALLALNGALANGHCVFPDKVVKRHPNFIFLAAANTTGTGATIDYVGRFKQDAAFNDRFVFLDWPLDEGLEDSLVADKAWLQRVRYVRSKIISVGIKGHLITPRAAIYGEALLAAGLSIDEVDKSVLQKGLSEAQWSQVKPTYAYSPEVYHSNIPATQ